MKRTLKMMGPLSVALASLLSVGCGSDSEDTGKDQGQICVGLPPLEDKDTYRVGFAQLWEDNGPWRNANTASMIDEAEKRGFELIFDPGTKSDPAEQVARMQALIDAKVDAIFLAPTTRPCWLPRSSPRDARVSPYSSSIARSTRTSRSRAWTTCLTWPPTSARRARWRPSG